MVEKKNHLQEGEKKSIDLRVLLKNTQRQKTL